MTDYGPPEAIPMPRDATDAQLRLWAAEGDDYSRIELARRRDRNLTKVRPDGLPAYEPDGFTPYVSEKKED